jgi:hypothetical protein
MPIITHSFPAKSGDPFNNLTVEVTDDKVLIHVHSYEKSAVIALDYTEARRLAETIKKEMQ